MESTFFFFRSSIGWKMLEVNFFQRGLGWMSWDITNTGGWNHDFQPLGRWSLKTHPKKDIHRKPSWAKGCFLFFPLLFLSALEVDWCFLSFFLPNFFVNCSLPKTCSYLLGSVCLEIHGMRFFKAYWVVSWAGSFPSQDAIVKTRLDLH